MDQDTFLGNVTGESPPPTTAATLGSNFVAVDAERGTINAEFQAKSEFTDVLGNIQAGFLAAMLDDTMGPALAATLAKGEFAPTLNLNVSFERTANVGVVQGRGRVLKKSVDVCFLAGELYQDGYLVASATATAIVRKMPA